MVAEEPAEPPRGVDLEALAVATGQAWASTMVGELRSQDRAVSGGWPGIMREARAKVMIALGRDRGPISADQIDALARTAYASARTLWSTTAEPDLEP